MTSPCIRICELSPLTGWCVGCRRTAEEIADWPRLSAEEKALVLERLARRRPE